MNKYGNEGNIGVTAPLPHREGPGESLFSKIWDRHVVQQVDDGPTQLYIDRMYCHEVTSPQAFDGMRQRGLKCFRPKQIFCMPDHNTPTHDQDKPISDPVSKKQVDTLAQNCTEFGLTHFGMMSKDTNTSPIDYKKQDIQKTMTKVDTILKKDSVKVATTVRKDSARQGYCIVLASMVTKKNAHAFVEELQKKGYEQSEVYVHKDITRVIYGNFKTQGDAYNALKKIHREKGLEEAWVYKFSEKI